MIKSLKKKITYHRQEGFTDIPNNILDAIMTAKLTGTQISICFHLMRYSYGNGQISAAISLHEFAVGCNSSRSYIHKQLKDLIARNIIIRLEKKPGQTSVYMMNYKVSEWA